MSIAKSGTSQQRAGILARVWEWAAAFRQALDQAEVARSNPYAAARIGREQLEQEKVGAHARADRAYAPRESGLSHMLNGAL